MQPFVRRIDLDDQVPFEPQPVASTASLAVRIHGIGVGFVPIDFVRSHPTN
jgi:hypothetical protein